MLRIMAGMDQKDSYAVDWFCWYCTSRCLVVCRYGDVGRSCAYEVPVLMQFQFQQFKVYVKMMVLLIQFIDFVLDILVMA